MTLLERSEVTKSDDMITSSHYNPKVLYVGLLHRFTDVIIGCLLGFGIYKGVS